MDKMTLMMLLPALTTTLFVFAYGACVGSLANVLVYRLPRGLNVVTPSSRCPQCETKLTWRENIPVFGWLMLGGKCRFCKNRISPEYPIVEAATGLLFVAVYLAFYGLTDGALFGLRFDALSPEWAGNGLVRTWPMFVVVLGLLGCLVPITLIDARTTQIPLILVWVPVAAALVLHGGFGVWMSVRHGEPVAMLQGVSGWRLEDGTRWLTAPDELWSMATPGLYGWGAVGASILGTVGVGVSALLLRAGLIRRSFADYDEWEAAAIRAEESQRAAVSPEGIESAGEKAEEEAGRAAEMWIQYPHARREMFKEIAYVSPPVALGLLGLWAGPWAVEQFAGPWEQASVFSTAMVPPVNVPIWLAVLSGVLLGYLVGAGVVWAIRILGSLAFGKEALGLGDVHLVAAIGACLGWVDGVLAFFGAAFVGLAWTVVMGVMKGSVGRTMPYGPYIAIATVLVVLCKPLIEMILEKLTGMTINLP